MSFTYDRKTFEVDCRAILNEAIRLFHPTYRIVLNFIADAEDAPVDGHPTTAGLRRGWVDHWYDASESTIRMPLYNWLREWDNRTEARREVAFVILHEVSHVLMHDAMFCIQEISPAAYKLLSEKQTENEIRLLRAILEDRKLRSILMPQKPKRRRK
jgi:hypothetical protein